MSGDQSMYIAAVVATYWFVSISTVYLNKVLMSNDRISIEAPLFITWFQCVITALICYVAGLVGERARKQPHSYSQVDTDDGEGSGSSRSTSKPSVFAQFPKAEYSMLTAKQVFPLSLVFVGMITFNIVCFTWVEVYFYNVARSTHYCLQRFLRSRPLGSSHFPKDIAVSRRYHYWIRHGVAWRAQFFSQGNHRGSREFSLRITRLHLYR